MLPEGTLRKLPAHLISYEPQAIEASFAFLRAPKLDSSQGTQAGKYVQKHGLNKIHDAVMVDSDKNYPLTCILMDEDEEDWSNSLNAFMLADGHALLEKFVKQ